MKVKRYNDKDIEKLLSELPDIKDEKSFDEYYAHISNHVTRKRRRKEPKRMKWVPILTTAAAFFIAFIETIQFIGNGQMDEANDRFSLIEDSTTESDRDNDVMLDQEEMDGSSNEVEESQHEDTEEELTITEFDPVEITGRHMISYDNVELEDINLVTVYLPDAQLMSLIPITLSTDLNKFEILNDIQTFDGQLPVSQMIYEGVQFSGLNNEGVPVVEIDSQSTSQFGSTAEGMLLNSLSLFFSNLNVNEVVLQNENGDPVNMTHIGSEISVLNTDVNDSFYYRIYQENQEDEPILTMEYAYSDSFEEVVNEMQTANEDFNFYPSISSDIDFNISITGETVTTQFVNSNLENNDETIAMIEALILTAKSFDFEQIVFEYDGSLQQVGPYHLSEPIQLDKYFFINPM